MEKSRGRGKNKCYWKEDETELLIEVLNEMACDPLWKTIGGFKSNYMVELHRRMVNKMPDFSKQVSPHIESKVKWLKTKFHAINDMVKQKECRWNDVDQKIKCERQWYKSYCHNHKEAKGLWDFRFPFYNQLKFAYGKDKANGAIVEVNRNNRNMEVVILEQNGNLIHNMEIEQNTESGDETIGVSHDSLSDEEENNAQNTSNTEEFVTRKRKTISPSSSPHDIEARLDAIDSSFRAFAESFTSNFAIMENAIETAMKNENSRQKTDSEKLKNVIIEVMKLNLSSDDVFKAAEIFATNRNKIDVFFGIPEQLRVSYVIKTFNANYASIIADDVAKATSEDNNIRHKLKDVISEIMNLNLPNDDVFKAADMFAADKNKIDVFSSLPEQLRVAYVSRLTGRSSGN